MTNTSAFSPDEWKTIVGGPPTAALMVITAARGGMFRETLAMSTAYAHAREVHGGSELLDEVVAARPKVEHTRHGSAAARREDGLRHLEGAVALLVARAQPEEVQGYRDFVLTVVHDVAAAHREDGQDVSPVEEAAIADVRGALGAAGG